MSQLRYSSGFTLIEILIVVAILGLLAVLMIPAFSSYEDEQKVTAAAQEIVAALRYARSEAMRTGSNIKVEIETDKESLEVDKAIHPVDKKKYKLKFMSSSILNGVDIVSVGGSFGEVDIIFRANGQPDAGVDIVLSYANHLKTVSVEDTTGRVSVQ